MHFVFEKEKHVFNVFSFLSLCGKTCILTHLFIFPCGIKSRMGERFFRYRLSWVVPDRGPLNGCYIFVLNVWNNHGPRRPLKHGQNTARGGGIFPSLDGVDAINDGRVAVVPPRIEPVGHGESQIVTVQFYQSRAQVGRVCEARGVLVRLVFLPLCQQNRRLLRQLPVQQHSTHIQQRISIIQCSATG